MRKIIGEPETVAKEYRLIWRDREVLTPDYFGSVRDEFNRSGDPMLLLYLIVRCVKGAVRYNSNGKFNQSADKRRLGVQPLTLRKNLLAVSALLKDRTKITCKGYQDVLSCMTPDDVLYMDPPYQGVCTGRDSRYANSIEFDGFVEELAKLNRRSIPYAISYDGRTGKKTYGELLPDHLGLTRLELEAGVSTQATLLGRSAQTVESLYLSPVLHSMLSGASATAHLLGSQAQSDFIHV